MFSTSETYILQRDNGTCAGRYYLWGTFPSQPVTRFDTSPIHHLWGHCTEHRQPASNWEQGGGSAILPTYTACTFFQQSLLACQHSLPSTSSWSHSVSTQAHEDSVPDHPIPPPLPVHYTGWQPSVWPLIGEQVTRIIRFIQLGVFIEHIPRAERQDVRNVRPGCMQCSYNRRDIYADRVTSVYTVFVYGHIQACGSDRLPYILYCACEAGEVGPNVTK